MISKELDYKSQIMKNLKLMVLNHQFKEVESILENLFQTDALKNDVKIIQGLMLYEKGQINEANHLLSELIAQNPNEVSFKMAYGEMLFSHGKYEEAYDLYGYILNNGSDVDSKSLITHYMSEIEKIQPELAYKYRKKLLILVKVGMDNFLDNVESTLRSKYEVKKVCITDSSQMDREIPWADIIWFEWCDELIIYGSRLQLIANKKIVCRLHSYEAFTSYISQVNWNNVHKVIFVAKHIKDYVLANSDLTEDKTVIIPNGIKMDNWSYKRRSDGHSIAYVGYINYKKGPMLLLQAIKSIVDMDNRFKLYIAGQFQDGRDVLYFNQMIPRLGLEKNVYYEGWQTDLDQWLEDKNYILCTSVLESQNMSVMQAMAKGIKPLIHEFVGARDIYPEQFLWASLDELKRMVKARDFSSSAYHDWVGQHYSSDIESKLLDATISALFEPVDNANSLLPQYTPLVSICITNYNYANYLEEAVRSVLNQSYKNIELIIVDDKSTDNSESILSKYEAYKNVRIIRNDTNRGYNYGIKQFIENWCSGEYFLILSADDILATNETIEKLMNVLISDDQCDLAFGNQVTIDHNGNVISKSKSEYISPKVVVRSILQRFGSGVIPVLFGIHKRQFYLKNNYFWGEYNGCANDTLNSLMMLKLNMNYRYADIDVVNYRHHGSNMTYNLKGRIRDTVGITDYIFDQFLASDYLDSATYEVIQNQDSSSMTAYKILYYYAMLKFYLHDYLPYGYKEFDVSIDAKLEQLEMLIDKISGLLDSYAVSGNNAFKAQIITIKSEMLKVSGKADKI